MKPKALIPFAIFLVLVVFLAIALTPLDGWLPPLSWAALVVDTLSRYFQIRIATRLFGESTAIWFGAWTVLSVPLILPWGTVDFGLHFTALLICTVE